MGYVYLASRHAAKRSRVGLGRRLAQSCGLFLNPALSTASKPNAVMTGLLRGFGRQVVKNVG